MSIRRIFLSSIRSIAVKVVSEGVKGLAGEEFDSEVYSFHGFSSMPDGGARSLLLEINGDANNYIALPPMRASSDDVTSPEAGKSKLWVDKDNIITVEGGKITITVGGNNFTIEAGRVTTDMDIVTTGDVVASGVSLKSHVHTAVQTGGGISGGPQ